MGEAGWLIDRRLGPAAEAGFYRSIVNGDIAAEELTPADWQRIAELVDAYALDLRHFRFVRPWHVDAFTLLP